MDFLELAESRFSVRRFDERKVERHKLDAVLRAGQVAPTACNRQPQRILVLESAEALEKLRRCTECHFSAPLALLVCYDKSECWVREFDGKSSGDIDASIVTTHMMLEAAAQGLGSTWVMYFVPEAVQSEFELDENTVPVSILTLGYPAPGVKPSKGHTDKKELAETVYFNSFK